MLLPISYIMYELSGFLSYEAVSEEEGMFPVMRPVFYSDEKHLQSRRLYLARSEDLPDNLAMETGSFLFYYGELNPLPAAGCYALPDADTLFSVCNRLHQIFDEAEQWQQHLAKMTYQNANLNDLLQEAVKYIPHPIHVMTPQFQLVAGYQPDNCIAEDIYIDENINDDQNYLNATIVNSLKSDSYYYAVEQYQKPFLYAASNLVERYLCINLFRKNVYVGRITVQESNGKIQPWESHFLDIIKEYVLPLYLRDLDRKKTDDRHRVFVQSLLQGTIESAQDMYSFLHEVKWKQTDTFICISFSMSDEDYENRTMDYFVKELERNFEDTFCVPFGNEIIMLLHLKDATNMTTLDEQLSSFIKDSNFRMGTSRIFRTLSEASFARQQAQIALQYGLRQNPDQRKHTFDDHVLSYLEDRCLEALPAGYVSSTALLQLLQRDRQNGSDYYGTLKCYLEHNSNMVQTAKALFIHRGTLIYRLDKITEITGIDLTDWTQQTYLSLSYRLLENNRSERI